MGNREELTEDWSSWDRDRLAYALEAHLIEPIRWVDHLEHLPSDERSLLEQSLENPFDSGPIGLGYTNKTGYFILFCGQGPCIGWIEQNYDHN